MAWISRSPVSAEEFGLLEDGGGGLLLPVGWVAVVAEDTLDHDADFGADGFAFGPVDSDAVANGLNCPASILNCRQI